MEEIVQKQLELANLIAQNSPVGGVHATAIARLFLIRASEPTTPLYTLHEPALCIVAQGRKQVILADQLYLYGSEQCLVVPIDLPIMGQVVEATAAAPYLCLRLDLDPKELGALIMAAELSVARQQPPQSGLSLCPVTPSLLDAAIRLLRLLDHPQDIKILAPLIVQEILYRLLSAEYRTHLRSFIMVNEGIYTL